MSGDPNSWAVANFGFCCWGFSCVFLSLEAMPEHAQAAAGCARVGCSVRGRWGPAGGGSTQALERPEAGALSPPAPGAQCETHSGQGHMGRRRRTPHRSPGRPRRLVA